MRLELEPGQKTAAFGEADGSFNGTGLRGPDNGHLKDGIAAARSGNRQLARMLLKNAVESDPASETGWLWLASISEYPEELMVYLDRVLAINPENARALEWRGATNALLAKTFVQRGIDACKNEQDDLALQFFSDALKHDPKNQLAAYWVETLNDAKLHGTEEIDDAVEINVESNPVAEMLSEAKSAAISGDRLRADRLIDEIFERSPDVVEAWLLRADITENNDDKLAAYQEALRIEPHNDAARIGYDSLMSLIEASTPDAPSVPNQVLGSESMFSFSEHSTFREAPVNGPTQELELPEEILRANPFLEEAGSPDPVLADWPLSPAVEAVANGAGHLETSFESEFAPETSALQNAVEDCDIKEVLAAVSLSESYAGSEYPPIEAPLSVDPFERIATNDDFQADNGFAHASAEQAVCPFCSNTVEKHSIVCDSCHAMLTLSDMDALLSHRLPDTAAMRESLEEIEYRRGFDEFGVDDLLALALGYLNLNDLDAGYKCLHEAALLDANNVIVADNLNTLAIRMDEIRRQDEMRPAMATGKTILVVDDSATVRRLISGKLEKSGHYVVCAEDGSEAVKILNDLVPDLVLLDIAMPKMDGYQTCKAIRGNKRTASVPVIMISGKDGFFDKVRGKMAGTTDYITKPFGPETLMKALSTYLKTDEETVPAE